MSQKRCGLFPVLHADSFRGFAPLKFIRKVQQQFRARAAQQSAPPKVVEYGMDGVRTVTMPFVRSRETQAKSLSCRRPWRS